MTAAIDRFTGEFAFLSNFWPVEVEFEGMVFPSSEHAYVAAKSLNPAVRNLVQMAPTAGVAKGMGRKLTLRPDWTTETRLAVMGTILRSKFGSGPLRAALAATGDATLIEGNHWGDVFWGICDGVGENHLGRLLQEIRSEIAP